MQAYCTALNSDGLYLALCGASTQPSTTRDIAAATSSTPSNPHALIESCHTSQSFRFFSHQQQTKSNRACAKAVAVAITAPLSPSPAARSAESVRLQKERKRNTQADRLGNKSRSDFPQVWRVLEELPPTHAMSGKRSGRLCGDGVQSRRTIRKNLLSRS